MATNRAGLPGTAVFLATAGGFLVYVAIRNVPVVEGLRSVLRGTLPKGPGPTKTPLPSELDFSATGRVGSGLGDAVSGNLNTLGARIVSAAVKHQGVPYVWGGATPAGWDCSGFVTWVLHRELGLKLPSNKHTVSAQFLVWRGAWTVPRAQAQPGDLLCWAGHIAINIDGKRMIHAPTFGQKTKIANWMPNPTVRRVLAQ